MIYMIGGVPRVGKTHLVQKVVTRKPMHAVSSDALRYMMRHALPHDALPQEFFLPTLADKPMDPNVALALQNAESTALWPAIIEFGKSYVEDDTDLLIEGVAVVPELLVTDCPYPVRAIILSNASPSHEQAVIGQAQSNPNDWMHKYSLEIQQRLASFFTFMDADLRAQAAMHGIDLVEVHDETFDQDLERAADLLLKELPPQNT